MGIDAIERPEVKREYVLNHYRMKRFVNPTDQNDVRFLLTTDHGSEVGVACLLLALLCADLPKTLAAKTLMSCCCVICCICCFL